MPKKTKNKIPKPNAYFVLKIIPLHTSVAHSTKTNHSYQNYFTNNKNIEIYNTYTQFVLNNTYTSYISNIPDQYVIAGDSKARNKILDNLIKSWEQA